MNKLLDSLHKKILKSKFAEEVTEAEIDALVEAKEHNVGWIPCSERLPEVDYGKAKYWVTIKVIGFSHVFTKRLEWDCNKKCWKNPNGIAISKALEVIAWKEIEYPIPYQPKGE